MVGTSKILTVSYGTFSCTLEGFDDPFSTMKSISEYFRDLAAEDRYFGAEPPTPDAEMLHRIAEREIQRRVEARVQDNSLVLRQLADDEPQAPRAPQRFEAAAPAAAAAAAAAPEFAQEPEEAIAAPQAEPAPEFEAEIAEQEPQAFFAEPEFEPAAATPRTEILSGDSIAAKLSRIRAVVSGEDKRSFIEDEHAEEDGFAGRSLASMFDDDEEEAPVVEVEEDTAELEADLQDAAEDALEDAPQDIAEEFAADEEDDSKEDDTQYDAPEIAAQDQAEDEDLDQPEDDAEDEIDLTVFSAELSADMAETAPQPAEQDTGDADALLSGLIGTLSLDDAARVDAEPTVEHDEEFAEDQSDEAEEDAFEADTDEDDLDAAELVEDDEADDIFGLIEDPQAHEVLETLGEQEELHQEALAEAIEEDEAEKAAALPLPQFDLIRKARARVVKMRRADFQAEVQAQSEASEDEAAEPEAEVDDIAARISDALGAGSLTDDAESQLISDLAAAQKEADAEESHAERARRAERLEASKIEGDDEVNRLMQETDREFSNSEGTRRRSAIQHLKAAVLARRSGPDESEAAEEQVKNRFRDDLERVVKPRRPVAGEGRSEPRRLAPLMLVSEQRVDVAAPEVSSAPVRPRRVSSGNLALRQEEEIDLTADSDDSTPDNHENMFSQVTSFAEYAEEVGAETLTDLLEAAAAYAAFVEGRDSVSRPEIMRAVAEMKADEGYTREDGLRSFGQLLRDGRIQKLERGRFAVAQDTRFRPEAETE